MKRLKRIIIIFAFLLLLGLLPGCQPGGGLNADAGRDFSITVGEAPTFDGCASAGDITNYQWKIIEAPDGMTTDAGKAIREIDANCSYTLGAEMGVDEVGIWVIELTVSDGRGSTSSDTVEVEVTQ